MKTGKIISLSDRFGFVIDGEGTSHYFNQRNLLQGLKLQDLCIGDKLSFTPSAGRKGMIANGVGKLEMHKALVLGERMIFTRKPDPFRSNEHPMEGSFITLQSSWHRSPDAAREELRAVVAATGANAAVNVCMDAKTFNSGNYHYTMHACRASVGLYRVEREVETAQDAKELTADSETQSQYVRSSLETSRKMLEAERRKQARKTTIVFVAAAAFIVYVFSNMLPG